LLSPTVLGFHSFRTVIYFHMGENHLLIGGSL
jgi:hypothetical protein